ncbi:hypothetical protein C2E23DRAFT_728878 [Lenzites betulinus]|nr:hypothetical protein C2E23DRAFT_728878 [Lenzites betulinus]
MPELDILHGFEYITKRLTRQWYAKHQTPFKGTSLVTWLDRNSISLNWYPASLQIFPRMFALGTDAKEYITCTVDSRETFNYRDELEPCPSDYTPSEYDVSRADKKPYTSSKRYLKPLEAGDLLVKVRGKELIFAAGYHAVRCHFGLEGTVILMPTTAYMKLVSQDCPGSSKDRSRANAMRRFVVPPELTTPGARKMTEKSQAMAVFAAFVGEEDTVAIVDHNRLVRLHIMSLSRAWTATDLEPCSQLWSSIWSSHYGPDWIDEPDAAMIALDEWRELVKPEDEPLDVKVRRSAHSILFAITSTQDVFNGYGQHTATDLLHSLALWPGMPLRQLCSDDTRYNEFKEALAVYAQQYVSDTYRTRCLSLPNRSTPLAFNYKSDTNYLNQYLKVYRKCEVQLSAETYNRYASLGMFNTAHTIGALFIYSSSVPATSPHFNILGAPYCPASNELIHANEVAFKTVPVFMCEHRDIVIYSVICARRPDGWVGANSALVSKHNSGRGTITLILSHRSSPKTLEVPGSRPQLVLLRSWPSRTINTIGDL